MRSIPVLVVLTLFLSACGRDGTPASGGVSGTVTAGPSCPVETASSPCPPAVWTGSVRAIADDGTNYGTETDAQGHYHLPLPAGSYEVAPVIDGAGPPSATAVSVTVTDGVMQTVDLQVDTGIR